MPKKTKRTGDTGRTLAGREKSDPAKTPFTLDQRVCVPAPETLAKFYTSMLVSVMNDDVDLKKAAVAIRCADGVMRFHRFKLASGLLPGQAAKTDERQEKIAKLKAELEELQSAA